MSRASGTSRGIGGEDAGHVLPQHDASRAPSGAREQRRRQIRAAATERRRRCRPAPRPMKPGTTGVMPRGEQRPQQAPRAAAGFGAAPGAALAVLPVGHDDLGRVDVLSARRRRATIAAARMAADIRSPRATSMSLARGARCPSTATAPHRSRYSRAAASMRGEQGAPCRTFRQQRFRDVVMAAKEDRGSLVRLRPPFRTRRASRRSSSRSVTPPSADATITSGPGWPAISAAARCDRGRVRQRGAAELPDFQPPRACAAPARHLLHESPRSAGDPAGAAATMLSTARRTAS